MDIIVFGIKFVVLMIFFILGSSLMASKLVITRETAPQIAMAVIGNNIAGAIILAACIVALFI